MPEAGGSSAGGSAESRDATAEPSTEALASGELKPPSAAELWRRSEVPSGTLRRVAALLAERRGLSFTEFLLRVVEEKRASVPEWRNVQQLMAEADTGELHRATLRMREVVDAPASREARKAACAALVLAAASGGTLDRLVESVETQGDVAMAELLEGAACVAQHREARPLVREWLRRELESPSPENPCALSPAYLGGEERRQAALALQGVLEDKAAGKRSKSRR